VGVAALFIASKYEEIYPPELKDFIFITDKAYYKQELKDMEFNILSKL
jgi:cyclin B